MKAFVDGRPGRGQSGRCLPRRPSPPLGPHYPLTAPLRSPGGPPADVAGPLARAAAATFSRPSQLSAVNHALQAVVVQAISLFQRSLKNVGGQLLRTLTRSSKNARLEIAGVLSPKVSAFRPRSSLRMTLPPAQCTTND